MFPYDERMARYLRATSRGDLVPHAERHRHLLEPDEDVEAHPEKYYTRVVELDLSTLEPYVVGPHSPDRARPVSRLAAEVADASNAFLNEISTALIGSCTNSSYEDMSRAADVAEQAKAHGLKAADINAVVLANACGPCIGQWRRAKEMAGVPNTIVTSYNRNFPRRNDGQLSTMNFIGSPEIVTAYALAGRLSFNPLTDTLTGADGRPFKLKLPRWPPRCRRDSLNAGAPRMWRRSTTGAPSR